MHIAITGNIGAGKTTLAYKGLQSDRSVSMNNDDYDFLVSTDKEKVAAASPRYATNLMVKYGKESGSREQP